MRIAALYDIHGNLPALEAVLAEVAALAVDVLVVAGDVIPGPMPRQCLDRLLNLGLPAHFIRGNADREVLSLLQGGDPGTIPAAYRDVTRWTAAQLGLEHRAALENSPLTLTLPVAGIGDILFCHATPQNDTDIITRLTPEDELLAPFAGLDVEVVVCGHTHMQFERRVGDVRVVNAGSVGMPYGEPGAYWLLLDGDVRLRHTTYDLNAAADRVRAGDYPLAADFAANNILRPHSEAEALAFFTR